MKTLIKKLNYGILIIGLAIFTSCGNNLNAVSVSGINVIQRTIPSLAITATKYTGIKISNYIRSASFTKNETEISAKKPEKTSRRHRFMPITIGVTGARMVSSNNL